MEPSLQLHYFFKMGNALGGNSYTQTELILFHNTLHAGYFFMFCRLLTFFKIKLFKKIIQEHYESVKQFESRSGRAFCQA